jgi:hypothetical protein
MASCVVIVNDILDGHVGVDMECFNLRRRRLLGRSRRPVVVPRMQPAGQWGWLTEETGLPIAEAI